ncbi:MAG TPA: beta-ketoacyl synthase N-terminal-like domain-containing protein [Thermoanaerobaculia bacterium]|jgi:3-oxoacyl-[acyl-carrier-protein] synthase II|nr:beta-ketoacyl synthase N-terminal-like domain-containing protein [Thermoanaerobaculia bacterium]
MCPRVVVTGAGVISPLADSPAGLHAALCAGRSGIKPIELFATEGIGCRQAGEIRPFEPRDYLGDRNLRPIDRTSRLLLVAAQGALEASGWTAELRASREMGLALGTTFCSVRTIAEFDRRGMQLGPSYASPLDFANSVINAAAGQAAIWHDLRGVNSTLSAGEASGLQAIAYAVGLIRSGRAEALLAGGAEELCFESFLGYHRAGRLCGSADSADIGAELAVPFDRRRNGFALAEGAAMLALEEAGSAAGRGAAVLAEVLGHGAAFAASREEGEAAAAVARAVRLALDDAGVGPEGIDALSASANGSVAVDRWEALGVARAMGPRAADLPVTAIKSMLGEAMGASGALQTVAILGTLADGALPGILGLESADEDFPLPGAGAEARRVEVRRALLTAVSADGHCCALILGAPGTAGGPA